MPVCDWQALVGRRTTKTNTHTHTHTHTHEWCSSLAYGTGIRRILVQLSRLTAFEHGRDGDGPTSTTWLCGRSYTSRSHLTPGDSGTILPRRRATLCWSTRRFPTMIRGANLCIIIIAGPAADACRQPLDPRWYAQVSIVERRRWESRRKRVSYDDGRRPKSTGGWGGWGSWNGRVKV